MKYLKLIWLFVTGRLRVTKRCAESKRISANWRNRFPPLYENEED